MTADGQWLKTCPRCGGDNRCAVAAGRPVTSCWCAQATVSTAAIAALEPRDRGKRCLCPACGLTEGDSSDAR